MLNVIAIAFVFLFFILLIVAVLVYLLFQRKRLRDLNAELSQQKKWYNMAYTDGLTSLKNRMAYIEQINEISQDSDNVKSVYAIMIDIDDFKEINDTFGHYAGDEVLKETAVFLQTIFEDDCYNIFRIGGDEFAIIALDSTAQEIEKKLLQLENSEDNHICIISYGYAMADMSQKNSLENAFARADKYMYEQKRKKKQKNK